MGTGRLEAFSDGVFAIAITLLVLELKVPRLHDTAEGGRLLPVLVEQWPAYVAYLTSFAMILIMWINHHALLARVRRSDHTLFLLNGFLLLWIAVVPFPTALVAEYLGHSGEHVAVAVYSGTFVVIALAFNLLWHYIRGNRDFLAPDLEAEAARQITGRYALGPPVYLTAFLLAFVHAALSVALCLALALLFALPTRLHAGSDP